MALSEVYNPGKKPKRGGGLLGSVLGGLAGLVAAPFTGGASLGTALGLIGAGSTAGGIAGELAAPGDLGQAGIKIPQAKTERRAVSVMMKMPEVQLASMVNAKNKLSESGLPIDQQEKYRLLFDQATERIRRSFE